LYVSDDEKANIDQFYQIYLKTGTLLFDVFTGAGFGCFIVEKKRK